MRTTTEPHLVPTVGCTPAVVSLGGEPLVHLSVESAHLLEVLLLRVLLPPPALAGEDPRVVVDPGLGAGRRLDRLRQIRLDRLQEGLRQTHAQRVDGVLDLEKIVGLQDHRLRVGLLRLRDDAILRSSEGVVGRLRGGLVAEVLSAGQVRSVAVDLARLLRLDGDLGPRGHRVLQTGDTNNAASFV